MLTLAFSRTCMAREALLPDLSVPKGLAENSPSVQGVLPESKVVGRVTPCAPLRFPELQQFLDFTMGLDQLTRVLFYLFRFEQHALHCRDRIPNCISPEGTAESVPQIALIIFNVMPLQEGQKLLLKRNRLIAWISCQRF